MPPVLYPGLRYGIYIAVEVVVAFSVIVVPFIFQLAGYSYQLFVAKVISINNVVVFGSLVTVHLVCKCPSDNSVHSVVVYISMVYFSS